MNILNHLIKELEATLTEFDIYENIELRISNVLKFDLQINNLVKYQKAEKINELVNKFKKILDENKRIKNYEITEKFFININLNIELFLDEFENISEIIKSDKKEKINTTPKPLPKAIRCDLGKSSESSEQLANFFDGAVVSTSQIEK